MRKVSVAVSARSDIEQAWLFYERGESGVGDYFESTIWSDIESLAHLHGIHARHHDYFRMIATTFPFGIYYRDGRDETEVVAVLDLRRDPKWITRRLRHR
jgi:plasmid stabilization system protein ParE